MGATDCPGHALYAFLEDLIGMAAGVEPGSGDTGGDDDEADHVGPIESFPSTHGGDTSTSARDLFDAYACDSDKDESGPEVVYEVELPVGGTLSATLAYASGIDVDVHLLSDLDPDACLARGDTGASATVEAGTAWVVVDTYRSALWGERPGAYDLTLSFEPHGGAASTGSSAMEGVDQPMFWSSCAPSLEGCFEDGGERFVSLPASGPVVKEAHLVTTDDGFGGGWPRAQPLRDASRGSRGAPAAERSAERSMGFLRRTTSSGRACSACTP